VFGGHIVIAVLKSNFVEQVVITKCYHLFCSPCIQRNLELRHRKCPGCGIPFGQSDVRTVYI
jgi:E3 ubiquitin-protein ligase BRE1